MDKRVKDIKEKSKLSKEEWKEYTKTVWEIANIASPNHPAVFPEEIPRRLIKLFSFIEETILDPFGGTGTTNIVAEELGRNSVYIDQSEEYFKIAQNRLKTNSQNVNNHDFYCCDSRSLGFIPSDNIQEIVTSPPYWNKANYLGNGQDLGKEDNYQTFFENMRPVFEECYRILEPGRKLCLITANVNQQTNYGLLTFPVSKSFINLLQEIGFLLISEIVWSKARSGGKWGSAGIQKPIFGSYPYPPNFLFKNVHEYILVFSKPSGPKKRKNGITYEEHYGKF